MLVKLNLFLCLADLILVGRTEAVAVHSAAVTAAVHVAVLPVAAVLPILGGGGGVAEDRGGAAATR